MADTSNVTNTHNGHEFVDLGLPSGSLWATCNVGATSPEQSGLYFAWGETTGFTVEQIENGERSFKKEYYKASDISGDLTLEQDAAHIHMGGKWRMPTYDECQELIDTCTVTWVTNFKGTGVAGYVFTSKVNGNSVFFPVAGGFDGSSLLSVGSVGNFWSASWKSSSYAWGLFFSSGFVDLSNCGRCCGRSVRGVCAKDNSFFIVVTK